MIRKKIFIFTIILIAVSFFAVPLKFVQAQKVGIKISPTKFEEMVDPGEKLDLVLKVGNESSDPKTFFVYLKDFRADGESGKPKLIAPGTEKGYYLASWIDITGEGTEFAPGEEKSIAFSINVPADIGPGGYYGGIYFGTEPPRFNVGSEDKGAGMSIAQQSGSLVLLRVKGDVFEEANIREFNTDKEVYNTPFEVEFLIRIENKGNVHVKPVGNIFITNMFGKEVDSIIVNENGGNILPQSIRRYTETWEDSSGFGRYKASLGLSYGAPVNLGGQGKQSLYTEKYFWIIPWRIIIPLILGFIFMISMMFLLAKLYKNKAVQKAMEQAGMGRVRYVKKFQGPSPTLRLGMILLIVFIVLFLIVTGVFFLFFA